MVSNETPPAGGTWPMIGDIGDHQAGQQVKQRRLSKAIEIAPIEGTSPTARLRVRGETSDVG